MSNIYIQEPPTTGKVMMKTTIGDIDIELWTRESPKACKNFIKLCYDGYYNDTIFHRVVKGFIAQGGDPLGTGEGGESIYGQPFKDEFHSRLRFCRRGLVAMANAGKDDNGSQFFFTLAATPELQNKHTIFGKVTGETLYNVLKFEECLVDIDDKPVYPVKILKTQVLSNPFEDIVPSEDSKKKQENKEKEKNKKDKKGVKDFKLLSFGEEAEEDEEEFKELNKKFSGKSKSAHDVLDDPKLSSEPALEQSESLSEKRKESPITDESDDEEKTAEELAELKKKREISDKAIEKLKKAKNQKGSSLKKLKIGQDEKEEEEEYYLGKDHADERKRMAESIKKEIRDFKRGVQKEKTKVDEAAEKEKQEEKKKQERSEAKKQKEELQKKTKEDRQKMKSLGDDFAMKKLMKFRNNIQTLKEKCSENLEDPGEKDPSKIEDNDEEDTATLLAHSIYCEDETPVLAKDANLKDDDWFEIYDPRNPINKRRRGESSKNGESNFGKNRPRT